MGWALWKQNVVTLANLFRSSKVHSHVTDRTQQPEQSRLSPGETRRDRFRQQIVSYGYMCHSPRSVNPSSDAMESSGISDAWCRSASSPVHSVPMEPPMVTGHLCRRSRFFQFKIGSQQPGLQGLAGLRKAVLKGSRSSL